MIGLVVQAGQRARFAAAAATLTGTAVAWAEYGHEDEIRDRVAGLLADEHLEGLMLGLVPYTRTRDLIPAALPVAVTRSAALDLALAWAKLPRKDGTVSVDTFDRETVDEVTSALGIDADSIKVQPFSPGRPVAEVVAFHEGSDFVITCRTGVLTALAGQRPVIDALATTGTIRACLHELALRIRADRQRFAAAVLRGDVEPAALRDRPEFAEAWIGPHEDGVVVFAPAALFAALTHRWVGLPLLAEARVSAGFGIGATARHSVALAEQAAARAVGEPEPAAYLMTGDGLVIGPMTTGGPALAATYREHGGLESLAATAGLSPATLSRLAAIERSLRGRAVTPGELARTLGITEPSGRRLIRKLGAARLAVGEGSSQPTRKGRPTRLYRLTITTALEAAG